SLASFKVEHGSDKDDLLAVSSYIDRKNHSIHDLNWCGVPLFAFAVEGEQQTLQQELRLAWPDRDAKFISLAGAHLARTESAWRLGVSDLPIEEREGTHIQQSQ